MYRSTLYDLDEMILQCRTREARDYIDEAYIAYKAGAYRSCIIVTWHAVYFDLVSKLRSLSLAGNESAREWVEQYDRLLASYRPAEHHTIVPLQKIESEILNKATEVEIELISEMEKHDLKRLKTDRNRCAHPTMHNETDRFDPPAELARLHLRNAVQHVLSRLPVRGMKAVRQVVNLVNESSFPTDATNAASVLRELGVNDLDDYAYDYLVSELVGSVFEGKSNIRRNDRTESALNGMRRLSSERFDPVLRIKLNGYFGSADNERVARAISFASHSPWITNLLPFSTIIMLNSQISSLDVMEKLEREAIADALKADAFAEAAKAKLQTFPSSVLSIVKTSLPEGFLLAEGLRKLKESDSYAASYEIITNLITPNVPEMSSDQIAALCETLKSDKDARGTYAMPELVRSILDVHPITAIGEESDWVTIFTLAHQRGPMSPEYRDELIAEVRSKYVVEGEC